MEPWYKVARQLAGNKGVAELGKDAAQTPPGAEALGRVFAAADAPVLILFDEVLNFVNRHRGFAEPFHAFIQNLTVAMMATTHGAAVISLPRSQVEMTDFDLEWQEKITKVVRRVAKASSPTTRPKSAKWYGDACSTTWARTGSDRRFPGFTRIGASSGVLNCRPSGR